MENSIKNPVFVVAQDDGDIIFFDDVSKIEYYGFEADFVAEGLYIAYDSEGQILKLVTVNEKTGKIEPPNTNFIKIPFIGKIKVAVDNDRAIKVIPQGIKDTDKMMKALARHLSYFGYNIERLSLSELVAIYQKDKRWHAR